MLMMADDGNPFHVKPKQWDPKAKMSVFMAFFSFSFLVGFKIMIIHIHLKNFSFQKVNPSYTEKSTS